MPRTEIHILAALGALLLATASLPAQPPRPAGTVTAGEQKSPDGESTARPSLVLNVKYAEAVGLENDPNLKVIRTQQRLRGLVVEEAWREYLPTASVSWNRNKTIIENEDDTRNQSIRLNVDQVVYDGGRRDLAYEAARNDLALSRYDYDLAVQSLQLQIRQSFYDLLAGKAQLSILQRSIDRQTEQLKFAESELRLGETTPEEVLLIRNRLNEIKLQAKTARINYKNSLEECKILLRLDSKILLDLRGDVL